MADLEVWLTGPVDGVPAYLQPAAHALLQAQAEVTALAASVDPRTLWKREGTASPAFHLLHLAGALDRLFTYARGEMLNDTQKAAARAELWRAAPVDIRYLILYGLLLLPTPAWDTVHRVVTRRSVFS